MPRELGKLPWESALFTALRKREEEMNELRRINIELVAENNRLHARLRTARNWANTKTENWRLRQQAWARERDELLKRIEATK